VPRIVAIGHHKNVGKDQFVTFCIDILRRERRGMNILRVGFASKVYEICYLVYGWAGFKTKAYYDANPHCKNDLLATMKTVRETLIDVGQHMRKYDDDVWINAALKNVDFDLAFLTDLRFPTEFLHCKASKAILIHMIRPDLPKPTDEADIALDGWDDKWDLTIDNNGDLGELYAKAERFVKEYLL
jgi:hypothetical protein